jgi:O-antigen/teichoic acid export membrane protein
VIAGRVLGPGRYGELASLLAIVGLVAYPLAALQLTVARDVSHLRVGGDSAGVAGLYRRMLIGGLVFGLGLSVVLAVIMLLARDRLHLGSVAAILLAALGTLPATYAPIVAGLTQGLERFHLFAFAQFLGPFLRIALLVPLLVISVGVGGAMAASTFSSAATVLVMMVFLRRWIKPSSAVGASVGPILRPLAPALLGVLAFTSLTSIDVVVAKLWLSDHSAGVYGAASFLGRLILYLPAAIALVVLPKVASRSAAGRASADILVRSMGATALMCSIGVAAFAVAPEQLLDLAFGGRYASGAPLMWLFGVAMTGFALLNLVFVYDLARHGWRAAAVLGIGCLAQLALFAIWHGSGQQLLVVDIVCAYTLLIVASLVLHGDEVKTRMRRRLVSQGT